jgi:RNA polymerase sigma-70 factor (ECF subfamily)
MTTIADIDHLLSRVALGDRTAFSELYDATSAKLYGVALRVLNNPASADEVLQESYMKVWRYADRYASNGMSPMTWLITIARNTAIDRLRATRATEDIAASEARLAAPGPTPEQSAIAGSETERILACLATLPDDRRAAINGAYLQGASYAELAKQFDVPINTMRTWLRRSLIALRECLSK